MTNTKNAIKNLENWFNSENGYDYLVDAIRWLLYYNPSMNKDELTEWLVAHDEDVCPPVHSYTQSTNIETNIGNKTIVEEVIKVCKE